MLDSTIADMLSDSYVDRFKAEYNQVQIRTTGLANMLTAWEQNTLKFNPKSPKTVLVKQLKIMKEYLSILEDRAKHENIDLS